MMYHLPIFDSVTNGIGGMATCSTRAAALHLVRFRILVAYLLEVPSLSQNNSVTMLK